MLPHPYFPKEKTVSFLKTLIGAGEQARHERLNEEMRNTTRETRIKQGLLPGQMQFYLDFEAAWVVVMGKVSDVACENYDLMDDFLTDPEAYDEQEMVEMRAKIVAHLDEAREGLEKMYNISQMLDQIPHLKILYNASVSAITSQLHFFDGIAQRPKQITPEDQLNHKPTAVAPPSATPAPDPIGSVQWHADVLDGLYQEVYTLVAELDVAIGQKSLDGVNNSYWSLSQKVRKAKEVFASAAIPLKALENEEVVGCFNENEAKLDELLRDSHAKCKQFPWFKHTAPQ